MRTPAFSSFSVLLACVLGISTISTIPSSVPEPTADTGLDKSMEAMHGEMQEVRYSGNPDADFAAMMVPHHEGAIEMAKVELQFGTNPRLRRLAQEIIITQQSEIQVMKSAIGDFPLSWQNLKRKSWCTR
jgi:uncharacterized protein (DUF305 family)